MNDDAGDDATGETTGEETVSVADGAPPAAAAQPEQPADRDEWIFMIDPAWQPTEDDREPPVEAVVGGWFVDEDGVTGMFRPNPAYEPSLPDLPTDPVDAMLQLVARGEAEGDEVLSVLGDVIYGVALDERGGLAVAPAPDEVLSVLVTTAPAHRARVDVPGWEEMTVGELADLLPDEGIDVLLNPGAPTSMRLVAGAVKDLVTAAVPQE